MAQRLLFHFCLLTFVFCLYNIRMRSQVTIKFLVLFCLATMLSGAEGRQKIVNVIPDAARPLPLAAVRLTGGPLKRAQDLDAKYLLELEPDRMLAPFRKQAALPPKAEEFWAMVASGETAERAHSPHDPPDRYASPGAG